MRGKFLKTCLRMFFVTLFLSTSVISNSKPAPSYILGTNGPALKEFHVGFRELLWRDSISTFTKERVFVENRRNVDYYAKNNEDLYFGGIKMKRILYGFTTPREIFLPNSTKKYNVGDMFIAVSIYAEPDAFLGLKKYLYEYLGEPISNGGVNTKESALWIGFTIEVWLLNDESIPQTVISINDHSIPTYPAD